MKRLGKERRGKVVKVTECVEGDYAAQEAKFGRPHRRLTVGSSVPEGKRGADDTPAVREDYSWLDDCREWLEGKEARHEYYARLGRQAVVPR